MPVANAATPGAHARQRQVGARRSNASSDDEQLLAGERDDDAGDARHDADQHELHDEQRERARRDAPRQRSIAAVSRCRRR